MSAKQATQSIFICNFLFRLKDFLRTDSKTDSGTTKINFLINLGNIILNQNFLFSLKNTNIELLINRKEGYFK